MQLAASELRVRAGALSGTIEWGEEQGDEAQLLHEITLLLEPLHGSDAADPKLTLDSVRLPVSSWAQLAGSSHKLGDVVRELVGDGESRPIYDAYGSLKLGEEYHEVVPSLLDFGARHGCVLHVRLEGRLNATDSPPSFASTDFTLEADVDLDAVRVIGNTRIAQFPPQDEAIELATRLLDVVTYEPPVIEGGCTVLRPRCNG